MKHQDSRGYVPLTRIYPSNHLSINTLFSLIVELSQIEVFNFGFGS